MIEWVRRLALTLLLVGATTTPLVASAATTRPEPVVGRDASADVSDGGLDLTRVQLGSSSDGRLRAALTLKERLDPKAMRSEDGPPGSVCLRVWTLTKPGVVPPDFLVCASADRDGELRGTVAMEQVNAQPKRVAQARVTRSSSRTIVLTFSRSAVSGGKTAPTSVIFAGEATKPGCMRVSCVDSAPNAPSTLTYKTKQ